MNTFQKYFSYINRIVVEEKSSLHNPKLIVAIQNGKYVLNTQNANYSFGSLHKVFQETFHKINLSHKKPSTCLLLGGGAGSVPSIFYNELQLNLSTTMVEIDAEIVALAKKYFKLNNYNNLTLVIDDAAAYVNKTNLTYDLIIIDVFNELVVPKNITSAIFFEAIKKLLNNKGLILFNFVSFDFESKQQAQIINQTLHTVFKKNYHISTYKLQTINNVFVIENI